MKTTLIALLMTAGILTFAQQPPEPPVSPLQGSHPKREKVESMRIAFLTQKLDLSPAEAEKFWPVYNEYKKKREELHKKKRNEIIKGKENLDEMDDKELEAIVDAEIAFRQQELDLQKEYHSKFKTVLPIKKVARLYRAEEQFARHLLNRISGKEGEMHRGGEKKKGMAPAPPQ